MSDAIEHTSWRGQPALRVVDATGASATVALQGGHLLSWCTPDGRERLYLSPTAHAAPGQAVRGGVPVIFPQFERRGPDTSLPRHGFARTRPWRFVAGGDALTVRLTDDDVTRALWPHGFALELGFDLHGQQLSISLACRNTGDVGFVFSAALHTYLAVDQIEATRLEGLQGSRSLDTTNGQQRTETGEAIAFDGREIDRIHWAGGDRPLTLVQPSGRLRIEAEGLPDVVVWNPGPVKAGQLDDLTAGDERRFVCVEAAAIEVPVRLEPGERWLGVQRLTALD